MARLKFISVCLYSSSNSAMEELFFLSHLSTVGQKPGCGCNGNHRVANDSTCYQMKSAAESCDEKGGYEERGNSSHMLPGYRIEENVIYLRDI